MTNNNSANLKLPAIGMIVAGALNALVGILALLSGIMRLTIKANEEPPLPVNEAEKVGYIVGTSAGYLAGLISVVVAPIIIYGAIRMLSGTNLRAAKTAAILSIVPATCCFPLSMVFGIWAFVALRKAEKFTDLQTGANRNVFPPRPPQDW